MISSKTSSTNLRLISDLQEQLDGEVRYDRLSRWLYSTDASSYQVIPHAVVIPATVEDVATTLRFCQNTGIPLIPRGSGTSLSGQAIGEGIVLDFTRHFDKILQIDPEAQIARVESGVVLDQLNAAAKAYDLMVGPDPSSSQAATLGGMAANNSTGSHSIVYGMMVDHVLEMEVMLSDGSLVKLGPLNERELQERASRETLEGKLYRAIPRIVEKYQKEIESHYPRTWRNVAGYNLNRLLADRKSGKPFNLAPLLVGSEGTLGIILSLTVNLVERPAKTYLALLHFDTLREALSRVPEILQHQPSTVELMDDFFINLTRQNEEWGHRMDFIEGNPQGVLIVEFAGDSTAELQSRARKIVQALQRNGFTGTVVERSEPHEIAHVWQVRKAGLGLLMSKRGDAKPLAFIDDTAVPVERLADYAEEVRRICQEAGTEAGFYAHASAGCLHINPVINLKTASGLQQFKEISRRVIETAIRFGGTSTGEHGEGFARSYYNEMVYGKELHQAFKEIKGLFDPRNLLNPGKIVEKPLPWDVRRLRFHPDYQTPYAPTTTYLDFSADGGFAGLVEMCNGQGNCRNLGIGTMCPSFRATRDETHSTRGRANALRAALTGYLGSSGLANREVWEVLDLCLSCKACKVECPSIVDMAKLKAEFLAQYQAEKGTPLSSLLFGNIATVNEWMGRISLFSKHLFRSKLIRTPLEWILGIDRRRSLPELHYREFQKWFYNRAISDENGSPKVVLWDDTYITYNEPNIGRAAVQVLEAAGFEVVLLKNRKCCGRPMISKGLLKQARKNASHNVELLYPFAEQGIPIVGVEPSCVTMFRDEYLDLVGGEKSRAVAQNTYFMEEFLVKLHQEGKLSLPWKKDLPVQEILVHIHCYQNAMNMKAPQLQMLQLIPGVRVKEIPEAGCCGMAGAFGYEKRHYDISLKIAEEHLLPAVRNSDEQTWVAAAGTSCRHQILDGTGRKVYHPVELLAMCLNSTQSLT